MQHSFDVDVAERFGIPAAIIINNLYYWIEHNKHNNLSYYDGHYWTYNSISAFHGIFPYMTENQIRKALSVLIDAGVVLTGNYNKVPYDRTLWYTITDEWMDALRSKLPFEKSSKPISIFEQMDIDRNENGSQPEQKPIPDINTDRKQTDINTDSKPDEMGEAHTRTPKATKHTYGEYGHVKLTDKERDTLFNDFGEPETLEAITFLDEYIEMKGTKYKSHYLALRKWVYQAVRDRKPKRQQASGGGYDWDNL